MAVIFQKGEKPQVRVSFCNKDGVITVYNTVVTYETEEQVCELMKLAKERLETWEAATK